MIIDLEKFFSGNVKLGGNRFQVTSRIVDNDNIILATSNVRYWKNKGCYVMWVDNDKVVYLKDWQVMKVYNHEQIGETYFVKLNRNFFKVYNCYVNDEMCFTQADTFDSLLELSKNADNSLWWKNWSNPVKYGM